MRLFLFLIFIIPFFGFSQDVTPFQDPTGFLWGLKNAKTGKVLCSPKYVQLRALGSCNNIFDAQGYPGYYEISEYIDSNGTVVSPAGYYNFNVKFLEILDFSCSFQEAWVSHFSGYQILLLKGNGGMGAVNSKQELVVPYLFKSVERTLLYDRFAEVVLIDSLKGEEIEKKAFYDLKKKVIIYKLPDTLDWEFENYILRNIDLKFSILNKNTKEIIISNCEEIRHIGYDFFSIIEKNKEFLFNANTSEKFKNQYLNTFSWDRNSSFRLLNKKGKEYLFDLRTGKTILRTEGINQIYKSNIAICYSHNKFFLYDLSNCKIISNNYDKLFNYSYYDGFVVTVNKDKQGLMDWTGKVILKPKYQRVFVLDNDFFCVMQNGKFGVVNNEGNIVIPIKYYEPIHKRFNGFTIGQNEDYDCYSIFDMHVSRMPRESGYGFFDFEGNEIIPSKYEVIDSLENNLFLIRKNRKYGLINRDGKIVIDCKYSTIKSSNEGILIYGNFDGKDSIQWGFVDIKGEELFKTESCSKQYYHLDYIKPFQFGKGIIKMNDMFFVIDKKGEILRKYSLLKQLHYSSPFYVMKEKSESSNWQLLNIDKDSIYYSDTNYINAFNDKYFLIEKTIIESGVVKKLKGMIDTNGQIILNPIYDEIVEYLNMIAVRKNKKWSIYKPSMDSLIGNYDVPYSIYNRRSNSYKDIFEKECCYHSHVFFVEKENECGIINNSGFEIIPCMYQNIITNNYYNYQFTAKYNGKWGIINAKNEIIVPFEDSKPFVIGARGKVYLKRNLHY